MGVPCHGHLGYHSEDQKIHCSLLKEPICNWCQLIVGGSTQEAEKCDLTGAESIIMFVQYWMGYTLIAIATPVLQGSNNLDT